MSSFSTFGGSPAMTRTARFCSRRASSYAECAPPHPPPPYRQRGKPRAYPLLPTAQRWGGYRTAKILPQCPLRRHNEFAPKRSLIGRAQSSQERQRAMRTVIAHSILQPSLDDTRLDGSLGGKVEWLGFGPVRERGQICEVEVSQSGPPPMCSRATSYSH